MLLPTMSEFLEGLNNSRLLDNSQIEQLLLQPEAHQGDVPGVLKFLQSKGWVTEFQCDEVLAGRGGFLFFGGYRLLDRLEETPAGAKYKAFHPALQKPVALTVLKPEWLLPADSLDAYLERLQKISTVNHPHLVNVLDAGTLQGVPFLLEELYDGTDLDYFVNEMGAVPAQMGSDFMRQACLGLQPIHDLGLWHGDLHPGQLVLTPVIRVTLPGGQIGVRPGPGAGINVRGAAITPIRPPVSESTLKPSPLLKTIDFAPPERLTQAEPTKRGDIYSLGACFYFLLAGQAPYRSKNEAEAIWNLQYGKVTPIRELRSDVPGTLATLIGRMLSRSPNDRPGSVFEVLTQMQASIWDIPLAPRVEQAIVPLAHETSSVPSSLQQVTQEHNQAPAPFPASFPTPVGAFPPQLSLQEFTPLVPRPTVEPMDSSHRLGEPWQPRQPSDMAPVPLYGDEPQDFFADHSSPPSDGGNPEPVTRRPKPKKKMPWGWIIFGLLLHITAAFLLIGFIAGWFK
jgi:serine/threonine protein kinase